ncbi:hypothetical protein ACFV0D_10665, partial [Streptomyces sp. NPDC059556]
MDSGRIRMPGSALRTRDGARTAPRTARVAGGAAPPRPPPGAPRGRGMKLRHGMVLAIEPML